MRRYLNLARNASDAREALDRTYQWSSRSRNLQHRRRIPVVPSGGRSGDVAAAQADARRRCSRLSHCGSATAQTQARLVYRPSAGLVGGMTVETAVGALQLALTQMQLQHRGETIGASKSSPAPSMRRFKRLKSTGLDPKRIESTAPALWGAPRSRRSRARHQPAALLTHCGEIAAPGGRCRWRHHLSVATAVGPASYALAGMPYTETALRLVTVAATLPVPKGNLLSVDFFCARRRGIFEPAS
jgi:hypothetical protein